MNKFLVFYIDIEEQVELLNDFTCITVLLLSFNFHHERCDFFVNKRYNFVCYASVYSEITV